MNFDELEGAFMRKLFAYGLIVLLSCIVMASGNSAGRLVAADHGPTSEAGEAPHGEAGAVPLDFKADLALWSGVTFILFVFVLGTFAWKPLIAGLDKRESSVRNDITAAEQARLKAEQMLAEHSSKLNKVQDEVREILAEARRDAETTKNEIIAEAQREAEASKKRSIAEIERARDTALKDLFDVMSNKVVDATQRVLSKSLSPADQERLVDEALAEFQQIGRAHV